jgi:retinol-binding protein 3
MKPYLLLCAALATPAVHGCATSAGSVRSGPPQVDEDSAASSSRGRMRRVETREPNGPDGPITPALRGDTIDRVLSTLTASYVFPNKAKQAVQSIRTRQKRGDYERFATGHALATALSGHINEILADAHFHVEFSAAKLPPRAKANEISPAEAAKHKAREQQMNGGFEKVERLPGNIGYIEVRSFEFPARGVDAAAAAMSFVSETDALIVDIRRNGGGEPEAVAALSSYFFAVPVHLNDLYFRPDNSTHQYWTFNVPGKRYTGREIYVLTSQGTASAAEEFAYNLMQLKRATIVGEVTWGGAHPGDVVRLNDHFSAFVPTGRAINPITKTNWEAVGVKPHLVVPAVDALRVAQVKILEKRIAGEADPDARGRLEARLRELEKN